MFDRKALARIRVAADLSQRELGRKAGCHGNDVSRYERGIRTPSPRRVIKLAKALGVPASELMNEPASQPERDAVTERMLEILQHLPESLKARALAYVAELEEAHQKQGSSGGRATSTGRPKQ